MTGYSEPDPVDGFLALVLRATGAGRVRLLNVDPGLSGRDGAVNAVGVVSLPQALSEVKVPPEVLGSALDALAARAMELREPVVFADLASELGAGQPGRGRAGEDAFDGHRHVTCGAMAESLQAVADAGTSGLAWVPVIADEEPAAVLELVAWAPGALAPDIAELVPVLSSQAATVIDAVRNRTLQPRLRQSERLLRLASDMARFGGWYVDLDANTCEWSDAVCDIHEMPRGTVISIERSIAFYAPECRERIASVFSACASRGQPYDETLPLLTASGRRVRVRTMGFPARDDEGRIVGVFGAFHDVDRFVEAEEQARTLAVQFDTMLENLADGFLATDTAARITYVNAEAERLLLRRREQLLGVALTEAFPGEQFEPLLTAVESAANGAGDAQLELVLDDQRRFLRCGLRTSQQGVALYLQDVTAQRRAATALRNSEARFRAIAQATSDAVYDWDLDRDHIWWSDSVQTVLGRASSELAGSLERWAAGLHPDDRERVVDALHAYLAGDTERFRLQYRYERDGEYVDIAEHSIILRDADGRATRMVGGLSDVSVQANLEAQLRRLQRIESVGQLTGGVAHDFNNLLTVILGNSELLLEKLDDQPRLRMLAEMSLTAARRGADLTRSLLAFARRQPLSPAPVDVNTLIAGMDTLVRRTLGQAIEFEVDYGGGVRLAMVDESQLEGALLNLCINARDAMPDGGRLMIETGEVVLDAAYVATHPEAAVGTHVLVAVSDTGTGMDATTRERAFEPFFTTKRTGQGTGLGLSMVYGFVRQTGGHVRLYSEPGHGTTVKLYLPVAPEAAQDETGRHRALSVVPAPPSRVLVVEDDTLVRSHVCAQLEALGHEVMSAGDGPSGLATFEREGPFDLLLTDVVMPGGMSGRDLAERVHEKCPGIAVLYMSGFTENVIVHEGRLDVGVQLLSKPFTNAELARRIGEALAR